MLEQAVGEPPGLLSLDSIRRRAVQRRIMQAGVASLAVLAVGLGATFSAYAARGGPATGGGKVPGGPPKYYLVVTHHAGKTPGNSVEVRARASGKVISVVRNPLPRAYCGDDVAAAGTHTFFMTCTTWKNLGSGNSTVTATRIYRFSVTNSGRATTPTPVKGGTLKGLLGQKLTASLDGSEVAIDVTAPSPNGIIYTNSVSTGIFVINTKTGKRAVWRTGRYIPGKVGFTSSSGISLTGNGSELVVLESLCHRTRHQSNCQPSDPREVRAFGPADRGGSLQGGQVLLRGSAFRQPRTFIHYSLITPDGGALTTVITHCPRGQACTLTVERIGLTSGKASQVLYRVRAGDFNGPYLENFTADPSGRFLIIDAKTPTGGKNPVNGWIDHGRLVPLTPANGFDGLNVVW